MQVGFTNPTVTLIYKLIFATIAKRTINVMQYDSKWASSYANFGIALQFISECSSGCGFVKLFKKFPRPEDIKIIKLLNDWLCTTWQKQKNIFVGLKPNLHIRFSNLPEWWVYYSSWQGAVKNPTEQSCCINSIGKGIHVSLNLFQGRKVFTYEVRYAPNLLVS